MSEHTAIGCTGTVVVATRGAAGPGEVSLRIRGSSDSYLAWSAQPISRGTEVVVVGTRGPRTVEVESLAALDEPSSPSDPLLDL